MCWFSVLVIFCLNWLEVAIIRPTEVKLFYIVSNIILLRNFCKEIKLFVIVGVCLFHKFSTLDCYLLNISLLIA